jgi:hypothetical protein
MLIITRPLLFRLLKKPPRGMALYPFVLLREKKDAEDPVLLNHEKIHLRQQKELLILPFYIWYLTEYFINRGKGFSAYQAYRKICFEQEAFANEQDLAYLEKRPARAFLSYRGGEGGF